MTKDEIIKLFEANKNERGIKVWERTHLPGKTFGLGVTAIKKMMKGIKKDNSLADELVQTDIFDAKIAALILYEPKTITKDKVEFIVEYIDHWMPFGQLASVTMPKSPVLRELATEWTKEDNTSKRICGYLFLAEFAKKDKKENDDFFLPYIDIITEKLQSEENFVKDAMNNALLAIGMRSKELNERSLAAAKNIGTVMVDYGDNSCEAIDVTKHLSSDRVQKKFN
jgi:3-methyladenine DNA glycosylase AlkD